MCMNRVMGWSFPLPVGSRRTRRGQRIWIPAADRDTFDFVGIVGQLQNWIPVDDRVCSTVVVRPARSWLDGRQRSWSSDEPLSMVL